VIVTEHRKFLKKTAKIVGDRKIFVSERKSLQVSVTEHIEELRRGNTLSSEMSPPKLPPGTDVFKKNPGGFDLETWECEKDSPLIGAQFEDSVYGEDVQGVASEKISVSSES
jgi:hypothetical protein